jgi:pilus assembly protein CpaE
MPIAIISVCADQSLQEALDYVSEMQRLGPVGKIGHYIDPDDTLKFNTGSETTLVAFVSLDGDPAGGLQTAEILRQSEDPKIEVIVASSSRDVDLLLGIVKEGKFGFLPLPANTGDVMAALKRTGQMQQAKRAGVIREAGKVYLFAGVSGGGGTTTIATHVALSLASEGKKTILVDHHRLLGHAALYLNIQNSGRSIYDLIQNEGRLDESLLESYVARHSSCLDLLCSPEVAGDSASGMGDTFKRIIAFLRSQYSYVIFDSDASDVESGITAAEAEKVFFVVSAEVAPLRDLSRYSELYGKDDPKYQVVVNHEGRSPVTASHVADTTGLEVVATFAELDGDISAATNAGRPVASDVRSFHSSLRELLNVIDPREETQPETKKSFWPFRRKS